MDNYTQTSMLTNVSDYKFILPLKVNSITWGTNPIFPVY